MNNIIFPKINLNNIKGVLIDIDNTLYPYDPSHQAAIRTCYYAYVKIIKKQISFEEFYKQYRAKRMQVTTRLRPQGSCRSRLFAFQALFEDINLPSAFNYALKFETLYWETLINTMKRSDDAYHFLLSCNEKSISVCAVSDMQAHFQIKKLQALGLERLINYLVTSEEVGSEKPSKNMFLTALQKLSLDFNDVIMIGDDESKDIQGAKSLGIITATVRVEN